MVGFMGRFKRKDSDAIDEFSHDFSHFSLSSPPRKTRRLDADLPPIMEEEEPEISVNSDTVGAHRNAIILFKSPSTVSLSGDSHMIAIFNDQFIHSSSIKRNSVDEEHRRGRSMETLTVIPWTPMTYSSIEQPLESMDAEDDSMEIEEMNERATEQQWQQQHCMVSQPHRSTVTPVTWFSAAKRHY